MKELSKKTQSKLDSQLEEFNRLRDRLMIIAGFAIGVLTAVFSFWNNIQEPYNHFIAGAVVISLISICVMIYGTYSNKLHRGMNSDKIEELAEYGDKLGEEFMLNEIAYNLDSFKRNVPLLENLQKRLNWCITAQVLIVGLIGIAIFLNSI